MSNRQTQIALDFGPEHAAPLPPSGVETESASQPPVRQYIEAAGVVVRIKSYKNTPAPSPNKDALLPGAIMTPPVMQLSAVEAENQLPLFVNGELVVTETMKVPKPAEILQPVEQIPVVVEAPTTEAPTTIEAPAMAEAPTAVEAPTTEEPVAGKPVSEPESAAAPAPQRIDKRRAAAKPVMPKTGPSKRGRKSLKQVSAEADLIEIPTDEVLFSKQYYTMGEVSEMFRVNQSLLRFWETEFDTLQPRKNKKGDRYFRPVDIKNLHLIYHLLRQKKYTIEGAKEFLKKNKKADERFEVIQRLQEIRTFLLEWKAQL